MSTVGLLGASAFQKPLFDVLTEDGHEVIVFSPQGPYPLLNGPHRTAFIDVRDVDALHAHAREVGIDFFVTDQTDLPIAAIHTLHARMGRPHPSPPRWSAGSPTNGPCGSMDRPAALPPRGGSR